MKTEIIGSIGELIADTFAVSEVTYTAKANTLKVKGIRVSVKVGNITRTWYIENGGGQ